MHADVGDWLSREAFDRISECAGNQGAALLAAHWPEVVTRSDPAERFEHVSSQTELSRSVLLGLVARNV
jgi:hypothetical protein